MTSLSHNIRKISKTISFVRWNPHIYRFSVTIVLVDISAIAYFHNLCQKSKILKDSWKMGLYLSEKLALCWWRHHNKGNDYYFKSNLLVWSNTCVKCFCQIWIGLNKRWKSSTYFSIDCFEQFLILSRAKMTWLSIWNLLSLRDFVLQYYHAKFGGNWRTNKGETEGGTMCLPPPSPSLYMN